MAEWPRAGGGQRFDFMNGSMTFGNQITCTTHAVKGAWVELVTATAFDAVGLIISVNHNSGAITGLLDIGVGGSGSESVLIPDINFAAPRIFQSGFQFFAPISVPKGTRISARVNTGGDGQFVYVTAQIVGGPMEGAFGRAETAGADAALGRAIVVNAGGTANTKGAWSQLLSATTFRWREAVIFFNALGNGGHQSVNNAFDIGIGGAGSEIVYIPNIVTQFNVTSDDCQGRLLGPIPVDIPLGTRISSRCQSETTDATDRQMGISITGFG